MRFNGCTMPITSTKEAQKLLEGISSDNLIVGFRRSKKAIEDGRASMAYVAEDIAPLMLDNIKSILESNSVDYKCVESKAQLGKACHIDCDAAIVVVTK